jgi:hypothetical protein
VSPRLIDGVYDILNFMTGISLFTHQLPHAADKCGPHLLQQFPQLGDVDASSITSENFRGWLDEQVLRFGEYLAVLDTPGILYSEVPH